MVLCLFQDFRKRRSIWKHISHSNDTEALAVDAFKKQCYIKVNRAIKWFFKRKPVRRFALAMVRDLRLPRLGRLIFNAKIPPQKDKYLCLFCGECEKTKKKMSERESRGVTGQKSRCAHINHVKLTLWGKRGLYLTRLNTFAWSKPLIKY